MWGAASLFDLHFSDNWWCWAKRADFIASATQTSVQSSLTSIAKWDGKGWKLLLETGASSDSVGMIQFTGCTSFFVVNLRTRGFCPGLSQRPGCKWHQKSNTIAMAWPDLTSEIFHYVLLSLLRVSRRTIRFINIFCIKVGKYQRVLVNWESPGKI